MPNVRNLADLQAWAFSNDDHFTVLYDDGHQAPVWVEEVVPGVWKFWSGRKWSSPEFRTRDAAAHALAILFTEYQRQRDTARSSGVHVPFDAREELKKRGLR